MQCRRCGKELGNSMRCTFCGYENSEGNVRELTRTEKNFFNGVTIDADSQEDRSSEENFQRQGRTYDFSTRRTYVNFGGSNIFTRAVLSFARAVMNGNRLAQFAATLIIVAIAALTLFVALPIIFVILAIGIVIFALLNNFR